MEVRIVDPDDGTPVTAGTIGMIQIRGPHVMRGICRRGREDMFTADGFYPTGDLGHLDDDGFMFYHGRSDDMFKVSGATVYPSEVEQALRTIDGVDSAFVTDVSGAVGAVVISGLTVEESAGCGAKAAERVQGPDGVAAGRLRRRHSARSDGQGRRPRVARFVARADVKLPKTSRTGSILRLLARLGDHASGGEVVDQRLRAGGEMLGHRGAGQVFVALRQARSSSRRWCLFDCSGQPAMVGNTDSGA